MIGLVIKLQAIKTSRLHHDLKAVVNHALAVKWHGAVFCIHVRVGHDFFPGDVSYHFGWPLYP